MVAFRSFFSAIVVALHLGAAVQAQGLFESTGTRDTHLVSRNQLEARQTLARVITCDTVNLRVLDITLAGGVCVCAEAGALTPSSLTRITTKINASQGVLAPVLNLVGGLAGAATTAGANALPQVLSTGTACNYPENSVPGAECGGCGYTCAVVNGIQYVRCGDSCVSPTTVCVSGVPQRRGLLARNGLNRCPTGYEACRIPGAPRNALGFECIDTQSDLEACGGCVTPFAGRPTGQDCSALPNVATASCLRGACEIQTCVKGFDLIEGECVETNAAKMVGYWEGLQAAIKVAAV